LKIRLLFRNILLINPLVLFFVLSANSQPIIFLDNSNSIKSKNIGVLPDKAYSFEQIISDENIKFKTTDTLENNISDAYWIKVKVFNPSAYSEKYYVQFLPMMDNTLYYFSKNKKKWIKYSNGLMVNNRQRNVWLMPCPLPANDTTELYIRTNISALRTSKFPIIASVWFEKESYVNASEQFIALATWSTVLVFILFLLYNAYIFFIFRDKTFLYYLVAQIGGLIFILGDQFYFNVLLPFRFCVAEMNSEKFIIFNEINGVAVDLAVALILFGYGQITRVYLELPKFLPKLDKALKYLIIGFVFSAIAYNILVFSKLIDQTKIAFLIPNLLIICIVSVILFVALLSYVRKHKMARYFLVANGISITLILVSSILYLFIEVVRTTDHAIIAKIVVIAQAFFLAIALVQRVLLIREELKEKQFETKELAFQNTLQKAQNDLLHEKLEANQRELASNALYLSHKNEMLLNLKSNMQSLSQKLPNTALEEIKNIKLVIQNNLYLDGDWERFRIHFEQVHPDFFKNLLKENPGLTQNEIRLCAYFHLNLSTKEIAAMLNIDPASVRKAKMRLNKKLRV
jgi:7TM diverse intracellular signalling/7TMR-DISM extracellular 2